MKSYYYYIINRDLNNTGSFSQPGVHCIRTVKLLLGSKTNVIAVPYVNFVFPISFFILSNAEHRVGSPMKTVHLSVQTIRFESRFFTELPRWQSTQQSQCFILFRWKHRYCGTFHLCVFRYFLKLHCFHISFHNFFTAWPARCGAKSSGCALSLKILKSCLVTVMCSKWASHSSQKFG